MLARMHKALLLALALAGCAEAAPPKAPPVSPPPSAPSSAPVTAPPLSFLENDLEGAIAKAKAEGKVVFIDGWAPWCHTCLSMKNFVFSDPSLGSLAESAVFVAIDTDRPEGARFLERYKMRAWPTFFVIDPSNGAVVGRWEGSGSVREMRGFVEESLAEMRGGKDDPASRAYAEARRAHAAGEHDKAAAAYERAIAAAPREWPARSAALVGWISALYGAKAWGACAKVGSAHAEELQGSASPADFVATLLFCAEHLTGEEQRAARTIVAKRLEQLVVHPPAGATADDRQDTLALLAEARAALGDAKGARAAQQRRVAILEEAAQRARTPELAHTFDYARAGAYVALDRADEAIAMLNERERQMPDAYEPPARLARVLFDVGRLPGALAAVERAIARSYGPRRLRYVALQADILAKMGDTKGAVRVLRDAVKAWEALPPGQSSPERIAAARQKLAAAEKAAAK
jgi:tetratricopeptide (TPR) repeat protein